MRIELDNGTIYNSHNGTKICDIEELENFGQAKYIIELLLDDRQEMETEIIELTEDRNKTKTSLEELQDLSVELAEISEMYKDKFEEMKKELDDTIDMYQDNCNCRGGFDYE